MDIIIEESKKLKDIKSEFRTRFPFLKIEFFNQAHEDGEATPASKMIDSELTVGEVSKSKSGESMKVNGLMKTSDFEQSFFKNFGFAVQVFRKSGNIWIQTTQTDEKILAELNKIARNRQEES